jgi:hypothetical protein
MTGTRQRRRPLIPGRRPCVRTFALFAALALAACTPPRDAAPIGGTLNVLGPDQTFIEAVSTGDVPPGWEVSGDIPADALSIQQIDRFRALGVTTARTPYALLRRTNASLLATPFLAWAWHTPSAVPGTQRGTPTGAHPVRIIAALISRDGAEKRSWWSFGGDDTTTRIIQLVWNETALGRGTVIGPKIEENRPQSAQYIARGGAEQSNRWWVDTVDLSLIHRQVWPKDDQSKFDIRYIGIVAQASPAAKMNVAAIRLMR